MSRMRDYGSRRGLQNSRFAKKVLAITGMTRNQGDRADTRLFGSEGLGLDYVPVNPNVSPLPYYHLQCDFSEDSDVDRWYETHTPRRDPPEYGLMILPWNHDGAPHAQFRVAADPEEMMPDKTYRDKYSAYLPGNVGMVGGSKTVAYAASFRVSDNVACIPYFGFSTHETDGQPFIQGKGNYWYLDLTSEAGKVHFRYRQDANPLLGVEAVEYDNYITDMGVIESMEWVSVLVVHNPPNHFVVNVTKETEPDKVYQMRCNVGAVGEPAIPYRFYMGMALTGLEDRTMQLRFTKTIWPKEYPNIFG